MNHRRRPLGSFARWFALGLAVAWAVPAFAQQQERRPQQDGQREGAGEGQRRGQFGGGPRGRGPGLMRRFTDSFKPDYLRRDLPLIREQLKLDEAQAVLVQTLLTDYEEAFAPASEAAQEKLQEEAQALAQSFFGGGTRERIEAAMDAFRADMEQLAAESGGQVDPEVRGRLIRERMAKVQEEIQAERERSGAAQETKEAVGRMIDLVEKWKVERTQLREQLVTGLRATLVEGQKAQWEAFERFMRRERRLPQGTLSGESVNLFQILDDAELSPETMAALEPILARYEMELDAALVARDTFLDQSEIRFLRAAQSSNQREADETARRASELHKVVREVNDRYRVEIVAALPEDLRAKVDRAALVAGYDRVYRPTQAERAFETALALEDLSPDRKPAIEALQAQYAAEVVALNGRILEQVQKQEPQDVVDDAGRLVAMMNGMPPMGPGGFGGRFGGGPGGPDGPLQELMSKRGDVSDAYMRRLRELLTPEQQEKLPQRGRGGRGGGQMAGGMLGEGRISEMPQQMQERVKQYDTNKDGVLDDSERQSAMEGLRREFGRGGRGPGGGGGDDAGGGPPRRAPGGGGQGGAPAP